MNKSLSKYKVVASQAAKDWGYDRCEFSELRDKYVVFDIWSSNNKDAFIGMPQYCLVDKKFNTLHVDLNFFIKGGDIIDCDIPTDLMREE